MVFCSQKHKIEYLSSIIYDFISLGAENGQDNPHKNINRY